jgi:rhodanese-related sulfurtransferase
MPLKVFTADGKTHEIHSAHDFEKIFQIRYLPYLQFFNDTVKKRVQKRCDRAHKKGWITSRQKWLGHYFAEGIRGTLNLDLTIAWINDTIGYGVWTNRDLPANTYIGEYTGLLRKRKFFGRWQNVYCFDYQIGEGRSSSFVIDAQDGGNHARFLNHASQPNVEPVSVYCDGGIHVILYTKQAIAAGSQLCYDYGEDYWKKRGKPFDLLTPVA